MNSKYLTIQVTCINTNKTLLKKVPSQLIEKMMDCVKHDLVVHVNKWNNQCYVVILGIQSILICSNEIDESGLCPASQGKFKKYVIKSLKKYEKNQVTQTKSIEIPSEYLDKISQIVLSGESKMLCYRKDNVNNVILIEHGKASILTNINGYVETQSIKCPFVPPTIQTIFRALDPEQLRCIDQELCFKTVKILIIIRLLTTYLNIDTSIFILDKYFKFPRGPTFTLHTAVNYGGDVRILLCCSVIDGVLECHRPLMPGYTLEFKHFVNNYLINDKPRGYINYYVMEKKSYCEQTYIACAFTRLGETLFEKLHGTEKYMSVYIINRKCYPNVSNFMEMTESYKNDFNKKYRTNASCDFIWS